MSSNIDINSKSMISRKRKRSASNCSNTISSVSNGTGSSIAKLSRKSKNTSTSKFSKEKQILIKPNEDLDRLIKQAMNQRPTLKTICKTCAKDIANSIRIIGVSFNEYCIECLISLKVMEDYHVVDNLNFSIFNTDWTAKEELQILCSIEKFGLDNWTEIATSLKSKPKFPCESHYYSYYCKTLDNSLPSADDVIIQSRIGTEIYYNIERDRENQKKEEEMRVEVISKQGSIPDLTNKDNKNSGRSRSLIKNRNRKDQKNITSAEEIVGYWPKREEFDIEFLNEAEIEIAELEFLEDDTKEDIELKLSVLKIYNIHLAEREARKK